MLVGREHELEAVLALSVDAAAGRGSVLVVSGEPGIGKTALLRAVEPEAQVLRATGVEAESAVALATLQALLWPLRDGLDELEAGQARLLRGILNLGPTAGATTFAVGAATLTLLSVSSREEPLVAIVDDAHWADVASQEVLCFVGRRLERERIALLVGLRDGEPCLLADERSFSRLELGGLAGAEARSLLEGSSPTALAPAVAERLLAACAGSPLALTELPLVLTDAQRRGDEPLPVPLEAGPLVQRAFAARASRLGAAAQHALLLLAAAGDADASLLARIDVSAATLDAIDGSGLVVRRAGRIEFRHPLMRSAIYAAVAPDDRRDSHRTLADATEGTRRAWHLAGATAGPDESVAETLVAAAEEARLAGGRAAEAQALERAADLTPGDDRRAARLLIAAKAWRRAGRISHARALLEQALPLSGSGGTRAGIQLERGSMLVREGEIDAPCELLLAEADRAAPTEPKLAAQMLVEASIALDVRPDTPAAIALAERACTLAGADGDRPELEAANALLTARMSTGLAPDDQDFALVDRVAELLQDPDLRAGSEEVHWIAYCLALHERDEEARRMSDRALAEARFSGDVWNLSLGLYARAALEQATGRIDGAYAWANEALPLVEQIGEPWRIAEAFAVLGEAEAARGDVGGVDRAMDAKEENFRRVRADLNRLYRNLGRGFVLVACGRFEEAIAALEVAAGFEHITAARAWYLLVPLELAEAYAGAGRSRNAEAEVRRVAPGIEACPLVRPQAKLARVQALLAPEAKIDTAFAEARALLEDVPQLLEQARVELCWGERLQRAGRGADAVAHLEHALARFEALGAVGWAGRTRAALEAVSGTTRPAQPLRTDVLTTQELRVSRHAAAGMRDREIAAELYLSPRTVESYLHSVYRKLGVSNRTQLASVLAGEGVRPIGAAAEPVQQIP